MFAKFNLKLSSNDIIPSITSDTNSDSDNKIFSALEKYVLNDGSLDAFAIELEWFPEIDAKVFLSHSHIDEKMVKSFANYLYEEYGITSFIDSTVWGYADNLIDLLYNKYCSGITNELELINVKKRIASFVYILLQSALTKMIDHCECFIFVNTSNSIYSSNDTTLSCTRSIWLYNELFMANRIRRRSLESHRPDELMHGDFNLTIPVEMDGLVNLTINDFKDAKENTIFKDIPNDILRNLYIKKGLMKTN